MERLATYLWQTSPPFQWKGCMPAQHGLGSRPAAFLWWVDMVVAHCPSSRILQQLQHEAAIPNWLAPCKSRAPALLTDTGIFGWLSFSTFIWKYLHDSKNHIKNVFYFPCLVYRRDLFSLFVKCFIPRLFKKEMWFLEVIQGFLSQVSQSASTELPELSKALNSFQLDCSHLLGNFGHVNLYTCINAQIPQGRFFMECLKFSDVSNTV